MIEKMYSRLLEIFVLPKCENKKKIVLGIATSLILPDLFHGYYEISDCNLMKLTSQLLLQIIK